jgi:4-hydroxy-tetrahydrodipicolinate reductase
MGRAIRAEVEERPEFILTALFDHPQNHGADVDGRRLGSIAEALESCDVIVDFSTAEGSSHLARRAAEKDHGPALVIGSTGLTTAQEAEVMQASGAVAIVKSGNFSLGLTVLSALVEQAAQRLGAEDWDIEIFEAHHRRKRDAPSGSALALGEAVAAGRGVVLADVAALGREGRDETRRVGEIGFSVMRGGGIVGEHTVVFAAEGEVLTLSHSARDRRIFARGAAQAALWVAARPPGLYDMKDVLGLKG